MKYTLAEINRIDVSNYTLSSDVMATIQSLCQQLGKTATIAKPIEKPSSTEYRSKKGKSNAENWKMTAAPTVSKNKVYVDTNVDVMKTTVDNIRLQMNKLSDKTYNVIETEIIKIIDSSTLDTDQLVQLGDTLYHLTSKNRFYSEYFAKLYSELVKRYTYMQSTLVANIQNFTSMFDEISCVNPSVNYELYCENNKTNEERRAITSFYVYLSKYGVIEDGQMDDFLNIILARFDEYIHQDNKKSEINELSEIIQILAFKPLTKIVFAYIQKISKSKMVEYKSLTNKAIFKFMDIIEKQ